ncbi:MAG: prephenate dehydrogenase/arogenate dehydrogenase family protein [Pirellulales bacterium]
MKKNSSAKRTFEWPTVTIVGVGLIGGSIGLALQSRKISHRIIGVGRSNRSLSLAKKANAITESSLKLEDAVAEADIVILATNVSTIPNLLDRIDECVSPGTFITDAGSTKNTIVSAWEKRRRTRHGRFVGSHPLTGSHKSGPLAASQTLFDGRVTVVTPASRTPDDDTRHISNFWSALGSNVITMSPKLHDNILAATSHAPHLISAAIALSTPSSAQPFIAGGWSDTTRIASGDPELWADILLDNAVNTGKVLSKVAANIEKMLTAIESENRQRLVKLLNRAKEARDALGG